MKFATLIALMLLLLHGVAASDGSEEESSNEEVQEEDYENEEYSHQIEESEGEEGGGEVSETEASNTVSETETSVVDISPATVNNHQTVHIPSRLPERSSYSDVQPFEESYSQMQPIEKSYFPEFNNPENPLPPIIKKIHKKITHYPQPNYSHHKCPTTPQVKIEREVEILKRKDTPFGANLHLNEKYHPDRNIAPVFENIPKMIDSPRRPRVTPPVARPPVGRPPIGRPPFRRPSVGRPPVQAPVSPPRVVTPATHMRPVGRPLQMSPPVIPQSQNIITQRPRIPIQPPRIINQTPRINTQTRRIITQTPRVIRQRPRVIRQRPRVIPQFVNRQSITRRNPSGNFNMGSGLSQHVVRVQSTPRPFLNIRATPQPIIDGHNLGFQSAGFSGANQAQFSGVNQDQFFGANQAQFTGGNNRDQFSRIQSGSNQFVVPQFASGNFGLQTTQSSGQQFGPSEFGSQFSVGGAGGQGFSTSVFGNGGLGGFDVGSGLQGGQFGGSNFMNLPVGGQFSTGNEFASLLGNNQLLDSGFRTGFSNAI